MTYNVFGGTLNPAQSVKAEEWDKLDQHIIDKAVEEWQKRLRACVAAGGGQFEQDVNIYHF